LRYLREAAALGEVLFVAINGDKSVRELKGPGRPVNCVEDRAEMLCALEFVDGVVVFEERRA
jgi:bifunctional ADP-heptose synthase (sugar kinase/adenylyltransferase)